MTNDLFLYVPGIGEISYFKGSKCLGLFRFKFFFWDFTNALLGCNREKF